MPTFLAFVDDESNLAMSDPVAFRAHLRRFAGRDVLVTVRRWSDARSLSQNAYWWAVPVERLAKHLGYARDEMHYALLGECFGYHVGPLGAVLPNRPSSRALKTGEFSQMIEWVVTWAAHTHGIVLPDPGSPEAETAVADYEGGEDA